jgi:hypothetical protein
MTQQRPFFSLLLILAVTGLFACGSDINDEPIGETEQSIINGKSCDKDTYPSAVAIIADIKGKAFGFLPIDARQTICTGTLIAPDVVLTAAHCTDPSLLLGNMGTIESAEYYISFTANLSYMLAEKKAKLPDDAVKVRNRAAHENFPPQQTEPGVQNWFDVGLLFLDQPVTNVQPAVVITAEEAKQIKPGINVSIVGWGMQQAEGAMNPFSPPPAGSVGIKMCAESFINELGTHEMQIGGDESSSRKCKGDSGGGSFMTVNTNSRIKERVIGITSHIYDIEGGCKKGGVDTRVDAWLPWIEAKMKEGCDAGTRSWCQTSGVIPPN